MVRAWTGEINNCECEERLPLDLMPLGFFSEVKKRRGLQDAILYSCFKLQP